MSLEVKSHINQFMVSSDPKSSEPLKAITAIVTLIGQDKMSLLDLVKNLGDFLTDEEESIRRRSLLLLSSTLGELDSKKLGPQDIKVLLAFYSSKLDDIVCTRDALLGIISLLKMDRLDKNDITIYLNQINEKYDPSEQLASARYLAFSSLNCMLDKYPEYLSANLNDLFIDSFIKVTTNEKDPKNLMLSFKINKKISESFDISAKESDLFDCLFCYFPISFRAPENNPYDVTGDQLRQALRDCISCNSLYAKDAFPTLLEKLTSTTPSVRMDVLQTIEQCIEKYDVSTIEEYWMTLWNSLKYEILHKELASAETVGEMLKYYGNAESIDERPVATTLKIFESMSKRFQDPTRGSYRDYLVLVYDSLKPFLEDPKSTKVKQSTIIMSIMCGANENTFNLLIDRVMSSLFKRAKSATGSENMNINDERMLLSNVSFMLDAYYRLYDDSKTVVDSNNKFFKFKDDIMMIINRSLLSTSNVEVKLRCLAVRLAVKLFKLNQFLQEEERQLMVQTLGDVLLDDTNKNTFAQILAALSTISKIYPMLILEYVVPKLMVLLPDGTKRDEYTPTVTTESKLTKEEVLDTLLKLSDNKLVANSVIIRLLNMLELILKIKEGASAKENSRYCKLLLFTISKALSGLSYKDSTEDYLTKFLPSFLPLVFNNICFDKQSCIYRSAVSVEYVSRSVKEIVGKCSLSTHQQIINDAFSLLANKGSDNHKNHLVSEEFDRVIDVREGNGTILMPVLLAFCSACSYENVKLPVDKIKFVDSLVAALDGKHLKLAERQACLQLISVTVNKWFTGEQDTYLRSKFEEIGNGLTENSDLAAVINILEVHIWVTKGLMLRDDSLTKTYVDWMVDALDKNQNGQSNSYKKFRNFIPRCFDILLEDKDDYANCFKCYTRPIGAFGKSIAINANIRKLYKQKFTDHVLPLLIKRFQETSNGEDKADLMAISAIVKHLNRQLINPHLKQFTPVLMSALKHDEMIILDAALEILRTSIEELPEEVEAQIYTVIPRLLEILNDTSISKTEESREKVLRCLIGISKFTLHKIMPFRDDIILGCESALDDDKRAIRKLDCDCRQIYYELGHST